MNTLGKRLKAARKNKGLTQQELEKLSGVSQQLISKIESEKIESTTEVFNLAEVLDVNAKWLATGNGEMRGESRAVNNEYSSEDLAILDMLHGMTSKQKKDTTQLIQDYYRQNQLVIEELTNRQNMPRKVA
ncbi:MAG: helix-turn-helix domain-containing protein [Methylococcaceae bacterium]|jgi:transcriptional regulator with XRE-family HTH domain